MGSIPDLYYTKGVYESAIYVNGVASPPETVHCSMIEQVLSFKAGPTGQRVVEAQMKRMAGRGSSLMAIPLFKDEIIRFESPGSRLPE